MQAIDKLAWIRIEEGRILAARSRGKDVFFLPGGKRETGETDQEALVREVREELSVELQVATLRHLGTFEAQAHGRADGVNVRMTCYTGDFTGELRPASEIEELTWLTNADRDRFSLVARIILDWLREREMMA